MALTTRSVSIVSVTMNLPTEGHQEDGVFVRRRLAAMSSVAQLRAIRLQPWFPGWTRTSLERLASDLEFPATAQRMFYLPRIGKRLDSWWLQRSIQGVLEKWHAESPIDLVDAHFGYPTGVGCARVAAKLGLPTFITLRGIEARYFQQRQICRQLTHALQRCAGVIAVSHSLKAAAVNAGVAPERIRVIPNAVDTTLFRPGDQIKARDRLGLPQHIKLVLSVGQLIHRKGHHLLIPAFARVRESAPNARLAIIGRRTLEFHYPARLCDQIKALGIDGSVSLLGALGPSGIVDWLQAADVFALPSYHEGCCNALLEALACGVPAVVTSGGDNAQYVSPGNNGYLSAMDDIEDLAAKIGESLTREWHSDRIAATVAGYRWKDVAEDYLEFVMTRLPASQNCAL